MRAKINIPIISIEKYKILINKYRGEPNRIVLNISNSTLDTDLYYSEGYGSFQREELIFLDDNKLEYLIDQI